MTTLPTIDLIIVLGFLVLVTIVGYALSKAAGEGLEDYFLGGKKIPWWVLGISTSTSNFDMSGTMIIVAMVFALGYKGFLVEIRGGVGLSLAFLLVFLGKWLRRSRVMTSAEWMKLRFGTQKQGRAAHLVSAVANIILSLGMIVYFAKGSGKFLTAYLPFSEMTCTSAMVAVGLFYTLMSGLYGVVFTDVVQMLILSFTAIFITIQGFTARPNVLLPEGLLNFDLARPETGADLLARDPGTWEPIFGFFGLCVLMWVARTCMEGMGGIGGYTDQRFFAARSERDASLLTLEAIVLSLLRWTMVAALVVMGYELLQSGHPGATMISEDAEQVLPIVLNELLPDGVRGVVLAGLIAAAMSTFDSTLNAGASYMVRDIYQSYMKPDATPQELMRASKISTAALCVSGVALAAIVPNINQIWGLLTMGLGAGLFVPNFLRWYWPRFNGYGFAIGTGVGIVAGLLFNAVLDLPLYIAFPTVVGVAFVGSVIGTLLTPPTDEKVLMKFFLQINPWGGWWNLRLDALEKGLLTREQAGRRLNERLFDLMSVFFAIPFQIALLVGGMAFIFHDWKKFAFAIGVLAVTVPGLYFFWYRNLRPDEVSLAEEEAAIAAEAAGDQAA